MKSFLDLETTPPASISSFLLAGARVHVDDNDASFLLSSPRSSVAASTIIMTDTAMAAAAAVVPGAATASTTATTTSTSATTSCSSSAIASPAASSVGTGSRGGSTSSSTSVPASHRRRHSVQPNLRHQHHPRHQRFLDKLDDDDDDDDGDEGRAQDEPPVRNRRHRYQHSLRLLDNYLWPDQRPSSSPPNHQPRSWSRSNSKSPVQNTTKYLRASSDEPAPTIDSLASSMAMTRDEFEALPPTIQRKCFSTLERLRFAQNPDGFDNLCAGIEPSHRRSPSPPHREEDEIRPPRPRLGFRLDELDNAAHRRSELSYKPVRVFPSPAERLRIQRHQSYDQLASHRRRQSVILDATDEAYIRIGKRQSKAPSSDGSLDSRTPLQPAARMHSSTGDQTKRSPDLKKTADSIYDSFRWLEDDDELDLRLYLDDYHFNLREEVPAPSKHRRPSFRRHLSINKLPFGGRVSCTLSRPATKEAAMCPKFMSSPTSSVAGSPGHVRRRSRALSLISPNRQAVPDASTVSTATDPAASHYQDPDARMKLRVYLASPHKFDEAIEFGFPSIDEVHGKENETQKRLGCCQEAPKLRTFLEDDQSSMYSEASAADPESPRTPEAVEKQLPARPARASQDPGATPKVDYAQAPASSREMTLRMTLTRHDLRAHEDQIYGWQKPPVVGRRSQARDEPLSPLPYAREGNSKESIERQFTAMDREDLAHDSGVVRRFWNRVRRT
ncbi:Uncharacterized protein TPAR_03217 [Tolypocladium paradoxum]|uniref:Mucin n=1 Tax=Tolypocladium paradoxum TaxID=94208 RepID=A0A2S4L290_9HYPO|nr:Uncharacterized protein TPAR_03217 [Tolypocladium paradoxum]